MTGFDPRAKCSCPPQGPGRMSGSMWWPDEQKIDPGCLHHGDPLHWPLPDFEPAVPVQFEGRSSINGNWGDKAVCARCGAAVPKVMSTSDASSGRSTPNGYLVHQEWHLRQDWLSLVGPKAPLYARAGFSLAEAVAAETSDEPPLPSALRAMAALRAADV